MLIQLYDFLLNRDCRQHFYWQSHLATEYFAELHSTHILYIQYYILDMMYYVDSIWFAYTNYYYYIIVHPSCILMLHCCAPYYKPSYFPFLYYFVVAYGP